MALETDLAAGLIFEITGFPASWVRTHLTAAVALDTDIAFRMTRLARLQVAACFVGVIGSPVVRHILL